MRRGLLLAVVAVSLVAVPVAYALLTQYAVRTSTLNEVVPAASADGSGVPYIGWSQNSAAHPRLYSAFLKHGSDARVKLNPIGQGYLGGIEPPTVVFQQIYRGQSNIRMYDIDTATRSAPPAGVNTSSWEWHPTISGDWLLFGRESLSSGPQGIHLQNLTTAEQRQIAAATSTRRTILWPGQVSGNWVVYSRCNPVCNTFRYDIANQTTVQLQKPATVNPRYQYASSVTSTGTVYLARSGKGCGAGGVKIVRFGSADPPTGTIVAALGLGRDTQSSYARENTNGSVDVFYDRAACATGSWNIYRINDP